MVKVKICGITRLSDAKNACRSGADALGFVFAKSPRRISAARAKHIADSLGPRVTKVGVFVNMPAQKVARIMRFCGLDVVQLHGDEPASSTRKLRDMGFPVIRAVRIEGKISARTLECQPADAVLLDTASRSAYGGTGRVFDWKLLKALRTEKPVIVSGGLRGDNVRGLLKRFKPFAVDVSSGVEASPGKKDPKLVRKFIQNAKAS